MDFKDEVYVFEGVILQPELDMQFAPDSDGGGNTGVLDISSMVGGKNAVTKYGKGTPKYPKLYSIKFSMRDEEGRDHVCALPSPGIHRDVRIDVNEGDKVALICSKKTDYCLRFINRSTGRAWTIAYGGDIILESKVGKKLSFAVLSIMSYIKALFHSFPLINIFSIIMSWIWLKKQYMPASARLKTILLASTCLYLFSYFIMAGAVQHTVGEHTSTEMVKTSGFKLITLPLALFTKEGLKFSSDEEHNMEFVEFYNSDTYNPNQVGEYLFNAVVVWLLLVALLGTLIQGTFINLLRRDQMHKQVFLDQLTEEEIAKGSA